MKTVLLNSPALQSVGEPTTGLLRAIRKSYVERRFVFVEGNKMKTILRSLGATEDDIQKLEQSGNFLEPDPTLPFRRSKNGRFLIDFPKQTVSRLEFQPFVLSEEEGFKRTDSGKLRSFGGIQDDVQKNTAFQALLKFQSCMLEGMNVKKRKNLEDRSDRLMSTAFQLRTTTVPELLGEPAKEGVHSDGVEHAMTTLLYTKNIADDSAITQIHTKDQRIGTPWDETNPAFIVGEVQHKHFLDTLLVVDSELVHSVSPVQALLKNKEALRDIILLTTRRLKAKTHETFQFESLNPHAEIPLEFNILPK